MGSQRRPASVSRRTVAIPGRSDATTGTPAAMPPTASAGSCSGGSRRGLDRHERSHRPTRSRAGGRPGGTGRKEEHPAGIRRRRETAAERGLQCVRSPAAPGPRPEHDKDRVHRLFDPALSDQLALVQDDRWWSSGTPVAWPDQPGRRVGWIQRAGRLRRRWPRIPSLTEEAGVRVVDRGHGVGRPRGPARSRRRSRPYRPAGAREIAGRRGNVAAVVPSCRHVAPQPLKGREATPPTYRARVGRLGDVLQVARPAHGSHGEHQDDAAPTSHRAHRAPRGPNGHPRRRQPDRVPHPSGSAAPRRDGTSVSGRRRDAWPIRRGGTGVVGIRSASAIRALDARRAFARAQGNTRPGSGSTRTRRMPSRCSRTGRIPGAQHA